MASFFMLASKLAKLKDKKMAYVKGQAICKDCGTGTLDNEMNEQFILSEDGETAVCGICGSNHIDGELYFEEEA